MTWGGICKHVKSESAPKAGWTGTKEGANVVGCLHMSSVISRVLSVFSSGYSDNTRGPTVQPLVYIPDVANDHHVHELNKQLSRVVVICVEGEGQREEDTSLGSISADSPCACLSESLCSTDRWGV